MYQEHHISFHVLTYTEQNLDRGWIGLTLVLQVSGKRPKYKATFNHKYQPLKVVCTKFHENPCNIPLWTKMVEQPTNQQTDDGNHRASSVAKDLSDKPSCNDGKT